MKHSRKIKKSKNIKKSRKIINNKLVIGGVCKECELNNKKIKEINAEIFEAEDVQDVDGLIMAYKFYNNQEYLLYDELYQDYIEEDFEICKIKNLENKNKSDYDYSNINVHKFVSFPHKTFNSIDELMKNVFLNTTPSPHGTIERNKLTTENSLKIYKMTINEKICIHSCISKTKLHENQYYKCEILITTYGKFLYNISYYGYGIYNPNAIELRTSETNLNEYAFFLSNPNINLLKCIINSVDPNQQKAYAINESVDFEILIKNIKSALITMKSEYKYIKEVEDCLNKNTKKLEYTKINALKMIKDRDENVNNYIEELIEHNKKISKENATKENIEKENEIIDDSVYGL